MLRVVIFVFVILGNSGVIHGQSLLGLLGLGGNGNQDPNYTAQDNNPNMNSNNDVIDSGLTSANTNDDGGYGSNTGPPNQYQERLDNPLMNNQDITIGTGSNLFNANRHTYYGPNRHNIYGNIHSPNLLENQLRRKIEQGGSNDEDVKLAAQKFPQLQNLLDKLKELNRQKDLQKQQTNGHKPSHSNTEAKTESTGVTKPDTKEHSTHKTTTNEPHKHHKGKYNVLTKKNFYFQVQPVRPDNEKKKKSETIYYEE